MARLADSITEGLSPVDFDKAAEYIGDELAGRKQRRKDKDQMWKEIDRQVAMIPKPNNIDEKSGRAKPGTEWLPFVESPLQAQTLETLNSDARRLQFPTEREWFEAHVEMNDDLMAQYEDGGLISGDSANIPSRVEQEDLDCITEAAHLFYQDLYDFRGAWDSLHGEAFKYGKFVGRARIVRQEKFSHEYRGVLANKKVYPALIPWSIKNAYFDDSCAAEALMNMEISKAVIFTYSQRLADVKLAAQKGSRNPSDMGGGWIPSALEGLDPESEDHKSVNLAEYEGDIVIEVGGRQAFVPNVIVTVVQGKKDDKAVHKIVRWRENELPFESYITQDYQKEGSVYGTGPLCKGYPLQKMISEVMGRLAQAAILNTEPPIGYDPQDPYFAARGGPVIEPRALWETISGVTPVEIGDPTALAQVLSFLISQYMEVTGVNAPRLGAQTKSHQTAQAIQSETDRGTVRTVDYVRSVMFGAARDWLNKELEMIRRSVTEQSIYVPKYEAYIKLRKNMIPKMVSYDVMGLGTPAEEQQEVAKKLAAIQQALSIEPLARQSGERPMDLTKFRLEILRDGGFANAETFFGGVQGGTPGQPQIPGADVSTALPDIIQLATGGRS